MPASRTVNCPRCGTPVEWDPLARARPFCSERCKMIDLGAWAAEKFKVPGEEHEADERSSFDADRE